MSAPGRPNLAARLLRFAAIVVVLAGGVWWLHPWTVRPIERPGAGADKARDPAGFVDAFWAPRLLPALSASAVDARTLLDALAASRDNALARYWRADGSGSRYAAIRGEGRITALDRSSANGRAQIDVAPFDGRPDLSLQIGPVLRGTALRDVTGLVSFTDFANQLQFADVANLLNARAFAAAIAPVATNLAVGRIVSFVGAVGDDLDARVPIGGVVPVRLTVEARGGV